MPKTIWTEQAERAIYHHTNKMGVFGAFEVTFGNPVLKKSGITERVDFVTLDTKGIVRCYEIKATKQDLKSKAKLSFAGDYNYIVIPPELEKLAWDYLPTDIGIILYRAWKDTDTASPQASRCTCVRPPKRREPKFPVEDVRRFMIRSMSTYIDRVEMERRCNLARRHNEEHPGAGITSHSYENWNTRN